MKVRKKIIEKAMETSEDIADFFADYSLNGRHGDDGIDTGVIPMRFLVVLEKIWSEEVKTQDDDYYKRMDLDTIEQLNKEIEAGTTKLKNKARSLIEFSVKMKMYFETYLGERCWMYQKGNPVLIKSLRYYPKDSGRDYAEIQLQYSYNAKNNTEEETITIRRDDFRAYNKDVVEVLRAKGFEFETPEVYKAYRKREAMWLKKATWQNEQMVLDGDKYINDNMYNKEKNRNWRYSNQASSNFKTDGSLCEIPNDLKIYCYDLKHHSFTWIDSEHAERYKYNPNIGDKLILPEEHKNLIDILLSDDIKELGSDIIEGKGGGTLILTKGKAGLGKTATAEIFSEKKQVALFSIHSGQLGIDGASIETKLNEIFEMAKRWECILLIDEADVYIRRRGDDVNHNAIVATFLRTMEYYGGILFMTTNREDDVDEAIESRCIAVLKYQLPSGDMSEKLWRLFIDQYCLDVKEEDIKHIAQKMVDMSGRDIKNITMLVSRYAQGMGIKHPDYEVFKLCATFRGKYAIG